MAVFLSRKYNEQYRTRSAWRPSLSHARDIFRIGWAPAVMFGNEMACWAIFMTKLAGSFGVEHNTAGWIVLRYMHLSFMPALGLSFAITSVVGKAIGAGRPDVARHKAKLGVTLAAAYMTLCAAVFVIFQNSLVGVFVPETTAPEVAAKVIAIGTGILLIAAVFQLFDGIGIALIGALRGAGDTVVPGVATIFMAWTLIVGLGWLLTKLAPGLESRGPWIGAAAYIIVLGLFLLWRWNSGAWTKIKLLEHSAAAVAAETAAPSEVEGGGPHTA
jgi:MATE family multidrug resistance protein